MLFLSEADVQKLLPMSEAIRMLRQAFQGLATGEAQNHPRRRLILPTGAVLHSMAAASGDYFGTKIYSTHPRHGAHFLFVLYHAQDAQPLALIEANHLGQIRTGAASGLATGILARPDSETLGIIGSGFQAQSQLEAILQMRRIRSVRVWSRKAENRESFAKACWESFGAPVEAVRTARQAVERADIVVTATSSREPVLEASWISPGTHINGIGSNQSQRRELPPELVNAADLIAVDSIEQARLESGDLLLALDESGWTRIVELKDLVSGSRPAARPTETTIFKSHGLGLEDVAVAGYVYESAQKMGMGTELPVFHS
jgi:ornithine cyclodeaminase/alanine dehydrogenase-like protein (mu-crystallin family)